MTFTQISCNENQKITKMTLNNQRKQIYEKSVNRFSKIYKFK